ncbi:MAG: DUF4915 domain-containing protein [Xenococcus sp. (in: cyanobacteria)]
MSQIPTTKANALEISCSRYFLSWLQEQEVSLAFTTYQTNRLFLVGVKPNGQLSGFERLFDRAMGLWTTPNHLYLSTRYQLWQFDNVLNPSQLYKGYDQLYVPQIAHTTGDLDIHDLVVVNHCGKGTDKKGGGRTTSYFCQYPI